MKVARLADLLEQWERWELDQLLPPRERSVPQPQIGAREALGVVHRALLAELKDLDAQAERAGPERESL